jgi:hypothetical protein
MFSKLSVILIALSAVSSTFASSLYGQHQYGHQQILHRPLLLTPQAPQYQAYGHQQQYGHNVYSRPVAQYQHYQTVYQQQAIPIIKQLQPLELNIDVPYIRIQTPLVRNPTPYEAQRNLAAAQSVAAKLNGHKNIPTLDVIQPYLHQQKKIYNAY